MSHQGHHPPNRTPPPFAQVGTVAWQLPVVQGTFADRPPTMSEGQLVAAHGCACIRPEEERHTLAEWDAIEAKQRAFAADARLVDAEGREIAALIERRRG
jgi:hypothetical protein